MPINMRIQYLLSGKLDYDLLICDDAGPGYAKNMGWESIYFGFLSNELLSRVIVVDNRMQREELDNLTDFIYKNSHILFFFKVVDPYLDNRDDYYYRFLHSISEAKHSYLLSVYEAKELTLELKSRFTNRYIHLPYPYVKAKEVNNEQKKNRILISGAINKNIYPYRYQIWKSVTRSFTRFFLFYLLKHPGYADLGTTSTAEYLVVKDNYIRYLSKYKFMLLCPSRCEIEFLKYLECAYAGCIPVGLSPSSYPNEIKKSFLVLRNNHLIFDAVKILLKKHPKKIVADFRNFLAETHNPQILNFILTKYIIENSVYSA
jgi:hypothetical protein